MHSKSRQDIAAFGFEPHLVVHQPHLRQVAACTNNAAYSTCSAGAAAVTALASWHRMDRHGTVACDH